MRRINSTIMAYNDQLNSGTKELCSRDYVSPHIKASCNARRVTSNHSVDLAIKHAAVLDHALQGGCKLSDDESLSQEQVMNYFRMYFQPSITIERIDNAIIMNRQARSFNNDSPLDDDETNENGSLYSKQASPTSRNNSLFSGRPLPIRLQQITNKHATNNDEERPHVSGMSKVRQLLTEAIDSGRTQLSRSAPIITKRAAITAKDKESVLKRTKRILDNFNQGTDKRKPKRSSCLREKAIRKRLSSVGLLSRSHRKTNLKHSVPSDGNQMHVLAQLPHKRLHVGKEDGWNSARLSAVESHAFVPGQNAKAVGIGSIGGRQEDSQLTASFINCKEPSEQDYKLDKLIQNLQSQKKKPIKLAHKSAITTLKTRQNRRRKNSTKHKTNGVSNDICMSNIISQVRSIATKESMKESTNDNNLPDLLPVTRRNGDTSLGANGNADVSSSSTNSLSLALDLPHHNWLEHKYLMQQRANDRKNNKSFTKDCGDLSSESILTPETPEATTVDISSNNEFPQNDRIPSMTTQPYDSLTHHDMFKPSYVGGDKIVQYGDWGSCAELCVGTVFASELHNIHTVYPPSTFQSTDGYSSTQERRAGLNLLLEKPPSDISPVTNNLVADPAKESLSIQHQSAPNQTDAYTNLMLDRFLSKETTPMDMDTSTKSDMSAGSVLTSQIDYCIASASNASLTTETSIMNEVRQMRCATKDFPRPLTSQSLPVHLELKSTDGVPEDMPANKRPRLDGKDNDRSLQVTLFDSSSSSDSDNEDGLVINEVFSLSSDIPETIDLSGSAFNMNQDLHNSSIENHKEDTPPFKSSQADKGKICRSFDEVIDNVLESLKDQEETSSVSRIDTSLPLPAVGLLNKLSILNDSFQSSMMQDTPKYVHSIAKSELNMTASEQTSRGAKSISEVREKISGANNDDADIIEKTMVEVIDAMVVNAQGKQFHFGSNYKGIYTAKASESMTEMYKAAGSISSLNEGVGVVQNIHVEEVLTENCDDTLQIANKKCVHTAPKPHMRNNVTNTTVNLTAGTVGEPTGSKSHTFEIPATLPSSDKSSTASSQVVYVHKCGLDSNTIAKKSAADPESETGQSLELSMNSGVVACTPATITELNNKEVAPFHGSLTSTVNVSEGTYSNAVVKYAPIMSVHPTSKSSSNLDGTLEPRFSTSNTDSMELQTLKRRIQRHELEMRTLMTLAQLKEKEKQMLHERIEKVLMNISNMKTIFSQAQKTALLQRQAGATQPTDVIDLTADGQLYSISANADTSMGNDKQDCETIRPFQITAQPAHNRETSVKVIVKSSPPPAHSMKANYNMYTYMQCKMPPHPCGDTNMNSIVSAFVQATVHNDDTPKIPLASPSIMQNTHSVGSDKHLPSTVCPETSPRHTIQQSTPHNDNWKVRAIDDQQNPITSLSRNSDDMTETFVQPNKGQEHILPSGFARQPTYATTLPVEGGSNVRQDVTHAVKGKTSQSNLTLHSSQPRNIAVSNSIHDNTFYVNQMHPALSAIGLTSRTPSRMPNPMYTSAAQQFQGRNENTNERAIRLPNVTHPGNRLHMTRGFCPPQNIEFNRHDTEAKFSSQFQTHQTPGQAFERATDTPNTHLKPVMSQKEDNSRSHNAPRCLTSENRNGGCINGLQNRNNTMASTLSSAQFFHSVPTTERSKPQYSSRPPMNPLQPPFAARITRHPGSHKPVKANRSAKLDVLPTSISGHIKNPPSYSESVKSQSIFTIPKTGNCGQMTTSNYGFSKAQPVPAGRAIVAHMVCSLCRLPAAFLCSGCAKAPYCTEQCQHKDWTAHKQNCVT